MNTVNLGAILGDRYRILRKLGEGGFGNTYLAEDINRFNELCVLKEFAPKIQGESAIAKAQELFQREAGILYQLQHPQIPKFRELFTVKLPDHEFIFLVQDYVEGQNYRYLLRNRQSQGLTFSEPEMTQLLLQILPVLHYIHSFGVIHRDISPENIMLRSSDLLPVLIDFGGVKQIEATVSQVLGNPQSSDLLTRLGKIGYAPDEQLNRGLVFPHSDLYALASTILVLLTGKEPQQLMNPDTLEWEWEKYLSLSSQFNKILRKMLAKQPGNRFTSADEILGILQNSPTIPLFENESSEPTQNSQTAVTMAVVSPSYPSSETANTALSTPQNVPQPKSTDWVVNGVIILILAGIAGGVGWYAGNNWLQREEGNIPVETTIPSDEPQEDLSGYSTEELERRKNLSKKRRELGIEYNFYSALVNELFWQKYPEKQGQNLSNDPEDASWREKRDAIAENVLQKLEFLSPSARKGLGSYTQAQQDQWKQEANKRHLSGTALLDLAEVAFLYNFPDQQKNEAFDQPIGQLWNGMIFNSLQGLKSGELYEEMQFSPNSLGVEKTANIPPGKGKAYVAKLKVNQLMTVKLTGAENVLLSIYTPSGNQPLLVDSNDKEWSGILAESGYYEFIIVSNSSESVDINLELTAENVTIQQPPKQPEITPTETPEIIPTETPEIIPTETPEVTPTETPEIIPTETPEVTPTETPEVTPTETPEVTPTETPEVTPTETPEDIIIPNN